MKKYFLLLAAVIITSGAIAQKGKVTSALSFIDQGALDKAKEALDQAFANEKSKNWFNTYFAQGKLCQAVYEADNPKFNSFYSDPLAEAYASYEKAIQLDTKGGTKKRIITNTIYNSLALDLYSQGSKQFEAKDFDGALKSFEIQIKITESDKYAGIVDTGMYYNAGLAAYNASKFNEAIQYFTKCADMKYQGINPHIQIYASYLGLGDTTKAEAYLLDLPNRFPGDNNITLQLVDHFKTLYPQSKQMQKIQTLQAAAFIRMGQRPQAVEVLDKISGDDETLQVLRAQSQPEVAQRIALLEKFAEIAKPYN